MVLGAVLEKPIGFEGFFSHGGEHNFGGFAHFLIATDGSFWTFGYWVWHETPPVLSCRGGVS